MEIELVDGSTIKTIKSNDVVRGRRAELYKLWNEAQHRELTKEEEDVINSFINPNIENMEWGKEYETIWVSSNESK